MNPSDTVVIGLSAVVVAIQDNEAVVLTVRPRDQLAGLPFGPFDPDGHRTFELGDKRDIDVAARLYPIVLE